MATAQNEITEASLPSYWPALLVGMLLVISGMACTVFSSPGALNEGQGTRDDPVAVHIYAKTIEFDVRALSVVWMTQSDTDKDLSERTLRVQLQVRCTKADDQICVLEDIGERIKMVDASGILYEPSSNTDENPLEGEILGGAEKAGWLVYRIPRGVEIASLVAEYGQEQHVFFELP